MTREEKSNIFRKQVKTLLDTGEAKNYLEIGNKIGLSKSMLSNILNNRAQVPNDKYRKFTEVYHVDVPKDTNALTDLIKIDVKCNVILSTLAEILANQRGQPVAKISNDLVSLVNSQVKERLIEP